MRSRSHRQLPLPIAGVQVELRFSKGTLVRLPVVSLASARGQQLRSWLFALRRPLYRSYWKARMPTSLGFLARISLRLAGLRGR